MSFLDKMKQKADEMGLTEKAEQAREKAASLAAENREKIDGVVDKAGAAIDQRTEGKYTDKIAKAKEQIGKGVDKVAEGDTAPGAAGTTGAAGAAGATGAGMTGAGVTPSSVNPPEVSEPVAGHDLPPETAPRTDPLADPVTDPLTEVPPASDPLAPRPPAGA